MPGRGRRIAATRGESIRGSAVLNRKGSGHDFQHTEPWAEPPGWLWVRGWGGRGHWGSREAAGDARAAPAPLNGKSQLGGRFSPERGIWDTKERSGHHRPPGGSELEQRHPRTAGRSRMAHPGTAAPPGGLEELGWPHSTFRGARPRHPVKAQPRAPLASSCPGLSQFAGK